MIAPVPPMYPRPTLTMVDMGMGGMSMGGKPSGAAMAHSGGESDQKMADMPGIDRSGSGNGMAGIKMGPPVLPVSNPVTLRRGPQVDNVAMSPAARLSTHGDGLKGNGRRVLTYADL